jgi:hypothetical protein
MANGTLSFGGVELAVGDVPGSAFVLEVIIVVAFLTEKTCRTSI